MKNKENDKLITGFMGYELTNDSVKDEFGFWIDLDKFYNSWNYLMKVVERIESIALGDNSINFTIGAGLYVTVQDSYGELVEIYENAFTKKEAVYNGIVRFINWYNLHFPTLEEDNNKLLVEYMGYKISGNQFKDDNGFWTDSDVMQKRWDYLMPVVQYCFDDGADEGNTVGDITHGLVDTNLYATYQAVVRFIRQRKEDYLEQRADSDMSILKDEM